jgi:hypothetical protein
LNKFKIKDGEKENKHKNVIVTAALKVP